MNKAVLELFLKNDDTPEKRSELALFLAEKRYETDGMNFDLALDKEKDTLHDIYLKYINEAMSA